jgi:hypothetical protein
MTMTGARMADEISERPKIKPDNNPWYLLATLYGEPSDGDAELQARNRMAWNRCMASEIGEELRANLLETGRHSAEELTPFLQDELQAAFAKRFGLTKTGVVRWFDIQWPTSNRNFALVDFSNVEFDRPFFAHQFVFPGAATFYNATFSGTASFRQATFSGYADFRGATFSEIAHFESATFSRDAHFGSATFSGTAEFGSATFSGPAGFGGATFSGLSIEAGRMMNASARMMESFQHGLLTIQKVRSGGRQTVVVQHVNVGDGGQAMVAGQVKVRGKKDGRGRGR